jgi:hypothetical protein
VHRNRLKLIKPTDTLNSNFIGITTLHVSGSISAHHQEFWAVHRLWYILCSCDEPYATRSRMTLQCHPTPGSIRSSELHKMYQSRCTAQKSWWWVERPPETCRVVIPIKLEFSVSVGFIHFNQNSENLLLFFVTWTNKSLSIERIRVRHRYGARLESPHIKYLLLHYAIAKSEKMFQDTLGIR